MAPEIIRTDGGEELVVLPRRVYDALLARAGATDEDEGTARVIDATSAALAAGRDVEIPAAVAEAVARGESPLRALREARGWTQAQLGEFKTSIGQGTISALENGQRRGTTAVWKELAAVLEVPMEFLLPD